MKYLSFPLRAATAIFTVLVATGCTDGSLVANDEAMRASADAATAYTGSIFASKQSPEGLPFKAVMDWVALPTFAPGFPANPFALDDFGGRCSVPSTWVLDYPVAGVASHLGNLSGFGSHCSVVYFNPDGSIAGGTGSDWQMIVTAANGDQLWFASGGDDYEAGTTDDGNPWWSQGWSVTGGTGRFLDADGHGTLIGVFTGFAAASPVTMEGTLSY